MKILAKIIIEFNSEDAAEEGMHLVDQMFCRRNPLDEPSKYIELLCSDDKWRDSRIDGIVRKRKA